MIDDFKGWKIETTFCENSYLKRFSQNVRLHVSKSNATEKIESQIIIDKETFHETLKVVYYLKFYSEYVKCS